MSDRRYKSARVDIQERLRLLVWINFNVLVWNAFVFERYPNALDEGTRLDVVSEVSRGELTSCCVIVM
jgi:hypothetical protein